MEIQFNLRELEYEDRDKQYYFILPNVIANDILNNDIMNIHNAEWNIEIYGRSWKIFESTTDNEVASWAWESQKPEIKLISESTDICIIDIGDKGEDSTGEFCIYYTMTREKYEKLIEYINFVEDNLLYFAGSDVNLNHHLYSLKSNLRDNFDIANLSGIEFEQLIANLMVKMGFAVQLTKVTGDEGIDLVVCKTDPIFGIKAIIQCKCYTNNSVGQPAIRDLYGVVMSEGANKGILITTSYFTKRAKEFVVGKPIELIDGIMLKELLNKYNVI